MLRGVAYSGGRGRGVLKDRTMTTPWKVAWITGASTGIGRALALDLARRGVRVAASARNASALATLEQIHPGITAFPLDVMDLAAAGQTAADIEARLGTIDLAILNAGAGCFMPARQFDAAVVRSVMDINYMGVVHGLHTLLPRMIGRGSGHIAIMASTAGYRGVPRAGGYAPAKAALISLAEALYPDVERFGVKISVINPGFVDTPMTQGSGFKMPFMITAEDASCCIIAGLRKGRFEIAFPWQMVWLLKLARTMPYWMYFFLIRRIAMARR